MPAVEVKYTYQDLLSTPEDGKRYELFEGDLVVSPAPTTLHQNTIFNLTLIVGGYVRKEQLGKVFIAPCDVYFREDVVVEPDLLFVSHARLSIVKDEHIAGAPDLAVEVLSPTSEVRDKGYKFKLYAEEGVKEYWLSDYTKRTLQVYRLTPKGFELVGEFQGDDEVRSPLFPELRFRVSELWK